MQGIGRIAFWVGAASLAISVVSRLAVEPVYGVEAHAIAQFAQGCLLLSIAASVYARR